MRVATAGHPPALGWALVAPRAAGGEGVALMVVAVLGSQGSSAVPSAAAGNEEPGKPKICVCVLGSL